MDVDKVTALIVNYNTPKLLSDAVHSIRNFYNVPIMVVDGSEPLKHEQMMEMISDIDVKVERVSHNITHGPGLKYGMDRIQTQYVMTMDSDAQMVKRGFLETCLSSMDEQSYGAGMVLNGLPWDKNAKYLHPFFALMQMSIVRTYNLPIKHGAPMKTTMEQIQSKGIQHILKNIENIREFVRHKWRGTKGPGTFPRRH